MVPVHAKRSYLTHPHRGDRVCSTRPDRWTTPSAAHNRYRRRSEVMANPFVKGWRYLMALFNSKIDEHADLKVQI